MSALSITLHAAGAEVASGTGAAVDLQSDDVPLRRVVKASLNVSAISGTLGLSFQTSRDGSSWLNASDGSYDAAGPYTIWVGECLRYLRVSWTLGGGESATFELLGEANQTYCTLEELVALGGAADILTAAVSNAERLKHLQSASTFARGYLKKAGPMPILRAGSDVAGAVARIAVCDILTSDTGVHPSEEAMELLVAACSRSRKWLQYVAAGKVEPDVDFSEPDTESTDTGGGIVYGDAQRSWSSALP